jgi:hypothetical protein
MSAMRSVKRAVQSSASARSIAALAAVLIGMGAVGSAYSCCCPPLTAAHETECHDGDEHAPTGVPVDHDPCPEIICPSQGVAVETVALHAPDRGPVIPLGTGLPQAVMARDAGIEPAAGLALRPTQHGPPLPIFFHTVLRL